VRVVLPLLLSLAASGALAWQEIRPAPTLSTASGTSEVATAPAQLELSAYSLPRFESFDRSTQTNRLALSVLGEPVPGRGLELGMSLGMTNRAVPGYAVGGAYLRPSLDLGFQWRYTLDRQYRIDFTAWHRVAPADAIDLVQSREPTYGARVEMGLASLPKSGFVADRGFLGLQLDGGARITVKRSAGRPMFYYRTTF
jgi:hypothetical protein